MAVIDVVVDEAAALPTDTDLVGKGCFICYGEDAPLVKLECCGTAVKCRNATASAPRHSTASTFSFFRRPARRSSR